MKLSLNTNIGSLTAQNQLLKASEKLQTSFERLSSGLRINRASDDPAGLAVASALQTESRLMAQAVRNVNDGISLLTVAEGALKELNTILGRQAELAQQAANGIYTLSQRQALQEESKALNDEANRIINTTEFNGWNLLSSSSSFQIGVSGDDIISIAISEELARTVGSGSFSAAASIDSVGGNPVGTHTGDFNGDGYSDVAVANTTASHMGILLGYGDGSFAPLVTYAAVDWLQTVEVGDFNGDGISDIAGASVRTSEVLIYLGNGNGTFNAYSQYDVGSWVYEATVGDFNQDGIQDLVTTDRTDNTVSILIGNGNGTFGARTSFAVGASPVRAEVADFNGDNISDLAVTNSGDDTVSILLGLGDGSFVQREILTAGNSPHVITSADFDTDGVLDLAVVNFLDNTVSIFTGCQDGSFKDQAIFAVGSTPRWLEVGDLNSDGWLDIITADRDSNALSVLLGKGNGAFQEASSISAGNNVVSVSLADFNGDGALDAVTADWLGGAYGIYLADTTQTNLFEQGNLTTPNKALEALASYQEAFKRVSAELGNIGAAQSRLSHTVNHLQVMRENYAAANSKIVDADIAEEVAQMVRQQILQQAITAVMAQANQQPALVLQLLK